MAGLDFDSLSDTARKIFLAGVGAVATGAEKSQELVQDLIEKGELSVEQGKAVNEELKHKYEEATSDATDALLRARLKRMTPEERAAWIANAQKISADLEAEPVEVEVDEAEPSEE
jgi:polyhydroxyalkanoate synthesis regulator phasin